MASLDVRHIQEADNTSTLQAHWGYPNRILPCTNDAGSCEYLDGVYWMHDISMLYTFIMWAVIGGLSLIAIALRFFKPISRQEPRSQDSEVQLKPNAASSYTRIWRGTQAFFRRWLLPESFVGIFGHVSRLQLLVLGILLGYLLIFS